MPLADFWTNVLAWPTLGALWRWWLNAAVSLRHLEQVSRWRLAALREVRLHGAPRAFGSRASMASRMARCSLSESSIRPV